MNLGKQYLCAAFLIPQNVDELNSTYLTAFGIQERWSIKSSCSRTKIIIACVKFALLLKSDFPLQSAPACHLCLGTYSPSSFTPASSQHTYVLAPGGPWNFLLVTQGEGPQNDWRARCQNCSWLGHAVSPILRTEIHMFLLLLQLFYSWTGGKNFPSWFMKKCHLQPWNSLPL